MLEDKGKWKLYSHWKQGTQWRTQGLKLFFLKDKHVIVILYNSCLVQWLLLDSFDGPVGNSRYIVSHVSLTVYILLLFKCFSHWTGFLLHFQGCMLFSRKCYICWSIYSIVGYSSWILKLICCDIELFLLSYALQFLQQCFCLNYLLCFKGQNVHLDMWSLPTLIIL